MKLSVSTKLTEMGVSIDGLSSEIQAKFHHAVAGIAKGAQGRWKELAQMRLKTSQADYIVGLYQAESFRSYVRGTAIVHEVQLVGRMPNNFEFGMAGFDMKAVRPGWLGGAKAKTSKDGSKYVSIPFRHSTTMSNLYSGKAALTRTHEIRGHVAWAARRYGLNKMTRVGKKIKTGPTGRIPKTATVHPYLRGLTRYQTKTKGITKSGKERGSSTLVTFRTMSEKSDPGAWIHPGITGAKILPIVERWVDNELNSVVDHIMRASK